MLKVKGLRAGYGPVPVLHDIEMEVGQGEAVAVVGANGAGKTALVRTLCGLVRPMAGSILKDGVEISHVPGHRRFEHGIAVVLENRNLFAELSVRDNLRLAEQAGKRRSGGQRFSFDEVCDLFSILRERAHSTVGLLSGGQQQMVAIARALLLQPDLLIMDELTTGLAPRIVKEILAVLNQLRSRGMSIVLVEQSVAIASEMTDRAYVLSVGRVIHEVRTGEWSAMLNDKTLIKAYLHG
ncbi:High-affinity branched-chain amino acid transport ATP-binding protein LivF [Cupriavidus laharis]|uniref:High-affinity branched-chain amino acid transport ATP-binding protein LivF n=1 Tax=Cupriavidus laharis TaxID=151654 RepID=A0ABM8WJP5_9BURK|nr:ABC transporter ATP-binding protein [Cupriavidus laharis]CAG9167570.1 High-affinity branched-chain amino acid transport ATP-binding protein LivF [Cupriavidus laharis]